MELRGGHLGKVVAPRKSKKTVPPNERICLFAAQRFKSGDCIN